MTTIDAPAFEKTITPETDRSNPRRPRTEYRAELDGQLVGYYPSYLAAEEALDCLVSDLLASGITRSAHELDGGDPDEIAAEVNWNSRATHTCYGLAAMCGQPATHRIDMPGTMVLWLCDAHLAEWEAAEPAPEPQGPEEDTNFGGWRSLVVGG